MLYIWVLVLFPHHSTNLTQAPISGSLPFHAYVFSLFRVNSLHVRHTWEEASFQPWWKSRSAIRSRQTVYFTWSALISQRPKLQRVIFLNFPSWPQFHEVSSSYFLPIMFQLYEIKRLHRVQINCSSLHISVQKEYVVRSMEKYNPFNLKVMWSLKAMCSSGRTNITSFWNVIAIENEEAQSIDIL